MQTITCVQIKKIHTLKTLIGIDDDLYREMLKSFGVHSSTKLTPTEAKIFIDILEDKARHFKKVEFSTKNKFYSLNGRSSDMATPAQLGMIEAIWKDVSYFEDAEFRTASLRKFLKNKFYVEDLKFLSKKKAAKVIQAILNIKKNLNGV